MIKYSDIMTVCWQLASSQSSDDRVRSQFDYGTRQRRGHRGYPTSSFAITVNQDDMDYFKIFWSKLNQGVDSFILDMPIYGSTTDKKVVRFITGYNIKDLTNTGEDQYYQITCQVEILQDVNPNVGGSNDCPLVPRNQLTPRSDLFPC